VATSWEQAECNNSKGRCVMLKIILLVLGVTGCTGRKVTERVQCAFAKKAQWPVKPTCPTTNLTEADAVAMAWQYASYAAQQCSTATQ
jgi:hypothetical protein